MSSNMHTNMDLKPISQILEDRYKRVWKYFEAGKHLKAKHLIFNNRLDNADLGPFRNAAISMWLACYCTLDLLHCQQLAVAAHLTYDGMYEDQDNEPTKRQLCNQRILSGLSWDLVIKMREKYQGKDIASHREKREWLQPWLNAMAVMDEEWDSVTMDDLNEPEEPAAQETGSSSPQSSPSPIVW